ncbi:MAG: hypothetical protein H6621_04940 [Halobacteriovoraceae bacterium]|nr:hypothetical protein [Halobacteriovoraceae bacterium]
MVKKLYLFSGKGGVGKSTLSLAFCQYLKAHGYTPHYTLLKAGSLGEEIHFNDFESQTLKFLKNQNIQANYLTLDDSVLEYIAKKLHSKTIASWILKTKFFQSLINIIPGFNYVIYMGKILENITEENQPKVVYVIDGPASGHSQILLQSLYQFKKIFSSGILYEDCQKMINWLLIPENFKINIVTLPSVFSINEALELKQNIESETAFSSQIVLNDSLKKTGIPFQGKYTNNRLKLENQIIEENGEQIVESLPFVPGNDFFEIVSEISNGELEKLI